MPDLSDPWHFAGWLLRHIDNAAPFFFALVGVIAWLVRKSGELRAPVQPLPRVVPDGVQPPPVMPARPPVFPAALVAAAPPPPRVRPQPAPAPSLDALAEPASGSGVTSFARRFGRTETLRDAIVAAEIFAPPPGLR